MIEDKNYLSLHFAKSIVESKGFVWKTVTPFEFSFPQTFAVSQPCVGINANYATDFYLVGNFYFRKGVNANNIQIINKNISGVQYVQFDTVHLIQGDSISLQLACLNLYCSPSSLGDDTIAEFLGFLFKK